MTTYYVVQNGSSKSPKLHRLIRSIKWHKIRLGCRVEVIHVPGDLMIKEGTDGLSRGIWLSPQRIYRSSLTEASLALGQVRFIAALGQWVLDLVGLSQNEPYVLHCSTSRWNFQDIFRKISMWIPTPEIARQTLVKFLDIWVEEATTTGGIFLVPRIMQRDWGNISRHVVEIRTVYPSTLPADCTYPSLIPFVILYVPRYSRCLPSPRVDEPTTTHRHFQKWHDAQAEQVRGL
jgi:hypothetical protein